MVVLFERDESLTGMLLGQLRSLGYECRPARIPVEVFDFIARYPVALVLVNLGQAATSRRDFWVALDNKKRERGVRYITYRYLAPGARRDTETLTHAQVDVEIAGPQSVIALVERVQTILPLSTHPMPVPEQRPAQPPAMPAGSASPPSYAPSQGAGARQAIAGVLNLSNGPQAGKQTEFAPMLNQQNGAANGQPPVSWSPEVPQTPERFNGPSQDKTALGQVAQLANQAGQSQASSGAGNASRMPEGGMPGSTGSTYKDAGIPTPLVPTMPMGDLANLTAALNALVAAGAPGYQNAAAAVHALDQAGISNPGEAARRSDSGGMRQDSQPMPAQNMAGANGYAGQGAGMAAAPQGHSRTNPAPPQANGAARQSSETMYASYPSLAETHQPQEPGRNQEARSHALGGSQDDFGAYQREQVAQPRNGADDSSASAWRPSGSVAPTPYSALYQNQMLAPVAVPGQVERSLSNVLVEGQLISQQRLEIALGIQRLLRGADIDYRLGELLIMFRFLTPDQLLAALLVSRGMVTPAQVAAMGRIKQELHNIGMEYDLENLLILFRLLNSEQLREIRSEIP
jgi:hypothetical protein